MISDIDHQQLLDPKSHSRDTLVTNAHPKVVKIQFSLTYYDFSLFILNFVLSAKPKAKYAN